MKGTTGRPKRRRENNTKIYSQTTGEESVDWFQVAQDGDKWRIIMSIVTNFRGE